ncbi:unnamed protein product, partial [Didymodactylos carnosus]
LLNSYTKMANVDQTTTTNDSEPKKSLANGAAKFDGDGLPFKGKLIESTKLLNRVIM